MQIKPLYDLADNINDERTVEKIIALFEPKIKKSSRLIPESDREDVEQELRIQMMRAIQRFDTSNTPGFLEFIEGLRNQK
jgi:DNA-directed RNA polymerase specialized sigma subunit